MNRVQQLLWCVLLLSISGCAHRTRPADDVYVYTLATPSASEVGDSRQLIEKFLAVKDAGDLDRSDDGIVRYVSSENVSETFEHDLRNGNFTFNKSLAQYTGSFVPQLTGPKESIRRAEEFLEKNGIAPRNHEQLKMVHLGGLRSNSVIDGKRAGPVVDELVTVNFGRVIDGTPVIGPGSKIVVNLGDRGEIMGVIHRWRELKEAKGARVPPEERVSVQESEELARRQIVTEFGEGTSYTVLASGKRYFDNNGGILQPVYALEVRVTPKDPKVEPFNYLSVVPMLRNSPEPLALTAIDPHAKELIVNPLRGQQDPNSERHTND